MKRIFVPTRGGLDWQHLLAKPKLHWKSGRSAMTAAASWESASDKLPPEIQSLLDLSNDASLVKQALLIAIPEWQVSLPGGSTMSCTDVLAICRNDLGLCVLGVEAKVDEDFGPQLAEKRAEASPGQVERLAHLCKLLNVEDFDNTIRYQLLHRTASALITAREFHAVAAVMLVHAFETPEAQRIDFDAFRVAMRAERIAHLLYKVPGFDQPSLYLAWCEGDPEFRKQELPSAI